MFQKDNLLMLKRINTGLLKKKEKKRKVMVLLHRLFPSNFLQFYFYNSKVWLLLLPVLQLDVRETFFF